MIHLYPSIDILDGKVVRLRRGDFAFVAEYPGTPLDYAHKWEDAGAEFVHIVDLDGAVHGEFRNFKLVETIALKTKLKVQLGGGVRTRAQINTAFNVGVTRVILGTRAVDQTFVQEILSIFGEKIAIGMDVKEGIVQTHGWKESSSIKQTDFLDNLEKLRAKYVVWTDISRDGVLGGPNLEGLRKVLEHKPLQVILSGGMSSLADLEQLLTLEEPNFDGVIIGRALYEKKIDLKKAVALVKAHAH